MESFKPDLHRLPFEIMQQIADHVSRSHRPSLYAFALASKICHSATLPLIFHHIHLPIHSREDLKRNAEALVIALSRTGSTCHVRCLSIKGSFRLSDAPRIERYKSGTPNRHSWLKSKGGDEILSAEDLWYMSSHVVYDEPVIDKSSEEDMAWAPVVALVQTLPYLAKLVYDCRNQFPPSLLDALHAHHPQCKLYHLTFRFRTLLWDAPHPYEMALVLSPCLHSVKVECCQRDSKGDDDFNQEALMDLVAGLAPNLKEVVVMNLYPQGWQRRRYHSRPREPWKGLPGFVSNRSIGFLTSLSLIGSLDGRSTGLVQTWARYTDFSHLRHLALGGGYDSEAFGIDDEVMKWIALNCSFPLLKTLQICTMRDEYSAERPNHANNVIAFLRAFPPLNQLSVFGSFESKILDAILDQHGPTLKKLTVRPREQRRYTEPFRPRRIPMTFTQEHILQTHNQCPALQMLAISVERSKSDMLKTEMYENFGQMARLKSLFLTMDCSDWHLTRDPDVRDNETLLNCPVDEKLVLSIWDTICRSKVSRELESLKVLATHDFEHLSHSWLLERVCRDDGDIINIRELGQEARETRNQK